MQKLVTSEEIKKHESAFIQTMNSKGSLTLMEKAGFALAEAAKWYKEPYLIVCGKGNNGGDGIVAARFLHEAGKKVFIALTSNEDLLSHDAKINFEKIKNKIKYLKLEKEDNKDFIEILASSNTVIDSLLGTGSHSKLSGLYEWIIKSINESNKTVISCDIPSGVNPDSGHVTTGAIRANETVTFAYPKLGLMVYPGKKYAGTIKTVDIGLPELKTNSFLLDDEFVKNNFPKRPADSNKGNYGKTLLVSGSKKYPGAALLSSKAASSIGSGLTMLASTKEVLSKITAVTPEVTHVEFTLSKILEESLNATVIVIGPGLTTEPEIKELVQSLITKVNIPIVLDADGINAVVGRKDIVKKIKKEAVLTPHPKEFARLLGITVEEVLENKIELAKSTAKDLKCTIVLKGPGTVIASKDGKIYISPFANSALAKGGTGDVLSGFIGGLMAQGLEPSLAACVGVYIHGRTGELVAADKTVFSLLPQDLITYLPDAIQSFDLIT